MITTCYRNISWQSKAWHEATQSIQQKSYTDHKTKGIRKYNGNHVNIATFVNRFRLRRKLEHGINKIMKASLRAQITHHKTLHDKISILTAIRHVHEANHGKRKVIECKDQ